MIIYNKLADFFKEYYILIIGILSILYFIFLFQYYILDYYVPDFYLYSSFFEQSFPSKDGFSSLFIQISGVCLFHAKRLTLFCLGLFSCSIFNILVFFRYYFVTNTKKILIITTLIFSSGIFYYTYGKLFYDFPFSIFAYSLALLALLWFRWSNNNIYIWFLFSILCGFHLSWKPYNIFSLTGLILLLFSHEKSREYLIPLFLSIKNLFLTCIGGIIGYLLGNYNLVLKPYETFKGLLAYPAQSRFWNFLFEPMVLWDHVVSLSFNSSIMPVIIVMLFLILIPLLLNKIEYMAVSIIMIICMYIFIERHSPGYIWHGFPFGLFILTYSGFLVHEIKIKKEEWCYIIYIVGISVQCINTINFINIQDKCFDITNQAVNVLEEKQDKIEDGIRKLVKMIESGADFKIESSVKRLKYRKEKENIKYTPVFYNDFMNFEEKLKKTYQVNDSLENKYLIYIKPNVFDEMPNNIWRDPIEQPKVISSLSEEEYTIFLVLNP